MSTGAKFQRIRASFVALTLGAMLGCSLPAAAVATPAHAASTTTAVSSIRSADVNDFSFDSFHADYTLGREGDGRSTLDVIERFDARFPDFDQNRGFIREIPQVYAGHTVDIAVRSVVDEHGTPRPFSLSTSGDYLWITMAVAEGEFVRGAQSYVIDYTMRDVTRHFTDTGVDEFYWDLNGTEWTQPFGEVSATLTLDDDLVAAATGDASCYRGEFGSNTACEITREDNTFSVSEPSIGPRENVSLAVAFTAGTFADAPEENYYEEPAPDADFDSGFPFSGSTPLGDALSPGGIPVLLIAAPVSFLGAIGLAIASAVRGRRSGSGRAIIAQYEPPQGVSVAVAAEIVRHTSKSMTASLLDFAVRGNARMVHDQASGYYGVQALHTNGLTPDEERLYTSVFGFGATPGTMIWIDGKSTILGDAAKTLRTAAVKTATRAGYLAPSQKKLTVWACVLIALAFAFPVLHAVFTLNFILFVLSLALGVQVLIWSLIGVVALSRSRKSLSDSGKLLHDHLMGLQEYIRLAEADRIRMLQSVSGAEVGPDQIVRIYERLLPYAVVFGYEKEWQQELARYYRESSPEWVAGSDSFSTALSFSSFHSAVSSQPVTRTVSSSSGSGSGGSFSSFSGGSSGGGFSGGGGGGGGGRGI